MAVSGTASASHTSVTWKGQAWDISDNATAAVDGDDHVTITRDVGSSADATLHINRLAPAPGNESFVNDNGTPWVMLSYLDNGLHRGVDIFVQDETLNAAVTGGSLFGFGGIVWTRYGAPTVSDAVFASGTRAAGTPHTLYFGQRPDGTVDINFDGTWYTSNVLRDNVGPFDFNDVHLRLRGGTDSGGSATFTDFQYGDNHPSEKDDCKSGGATPGFKNQGDCVSLFASDGKSN
jgi:hypothetical protein